MTIIIKEAKKLLSSDIVIREVSKTEIGKLQRWLDQLTNLKRKAKIVKKSIVIMTFSVRTDKFNIKDKRDIIV